MKQEPKRATLLSFKYNIKHWNINNNKYTFYNKYLSESPKMINT